MEQHSANGALTGLRVLDLSHGIAGPFAARLLGDHGADVIKIERPSSGDFARTLSPLKHDAPFPEQSLLFQYLNWNKRSLALDLRLDENKPLLRRLIEHSDVVIESFRPGRLQAWGLGVDQLLEWKPSLVVTSITNFGQTGPYATFSASDLTLQAMSGIMQISGQVDREPLKHGFTAPDSPLPMPPSWPILPRRLTNSVNTSMYRFMNAWPQNLYSMNLITHF